MSSRKVLLSIALVTLISGCSSAPEKQYEVRTYQRMSYSWMALADRKRQQEEYVQALELYQRALKYAQKRNDLFNIGISKLKSAAIYITLKQFERADELIRQVTQTDEYEPVDLGNPIKFIRAKLLHAQGNTVKAVELLKQLEASYLEDVERNIYYRLVRWSYDNSSVSMATIEADLVVLDTLVAEHKLNNIEIYSFALYQHAKWLAEQRDSAAETAINQAISHFSTLELTAKIKDCYQLAVDYYQAVGQSDKAVYFRQRVGFLKRPLQ